MARSKSKPLKDGSLVCLGKDGLIYVDGKDMTYAYTAIGDDEKIVKDHGGQEALDFYKQKKAERKAAEIEEKTREVREAA